MASPIPLVVLHIVAGSIAIACGAAALAFRKGSGAHVYAGRGFGISMAVMLASAGILTVFTSRTNEIPGIMFFLYLVASGWQTVRSRGVAGQFERWTITIPIAFALLAFVDALQRPAGSIPPAGLMFFIAFISMLAAVGDARYLRRGVLPRVAKLSRHIWRISIALFAATGSFFLGQAKVLPIAMRQQPALLITLAVAPLLFMLFWLIWLRIGAKPGAEARATVAPEVAD